MGIVTVLRLLARRRILAQRDRWRREQLESFQRGSLRALRQFAMDRSPFYASFHRGLADAPLAGLPVLTKSLLMQNYDSVATDSRVRLGEIEAWIAARRGGRYLGRYRVTATAGSSGLKGIFVSGPEEWLTVLASYARASQWAGTAAGLFRRTRIAVVSSRNPAHQSAVVGQTLQSLWVPTLRLDAAQPMTEIVDALNEFQPDSLIAYASMAPLLGEEQIAGRLRIRPGAVQCSSEVLTREARERTERAFGVPVREVYAATETAGIASQCERGSFHLYEDLLIPEVVDVANRPVPRGEFGDKLLVTVLFSRTLPLIRYEMTDRVRLIDGTCDCGRPFGLLGAVEGRSDDALEFSSPAGGNVRLHPLALQEAMEGVPVRAWQIVGERAQLRVLLAGASAGLRDDAVRKRLVEAVVSRGGSPPVIQVERVDDIARTAAGKAPLIRRER